MFNGTPDISQPDGIPQIKFADPELLRKLNIPVPDGMPETPRPMAETSGNMFDFSQGAANKTPQSATTQSPQFSQPSPERQVSPEQQMTADESANQDGMSEGMQKNINTDGPEAAFAQTYDALSKKQREIVDLMAGQLKFADLFQKRRFSLKFDIVPGQLRVTFVSMSQEENEDFWKKFRDIQLNKFEIELMMNLHRCAYTIAELNNSAIPVNQRLDLFKSFDNSLIHVLANYSSLFELAKMKVLYQSFLAIQGE